MEARAKNRGRETKTFKLLLENNKNMNMVATEYENMAQDSLEEFREDLEPRNVELKKKTIFTGDER